MNRYEAFLIKEINKHDNTITVLAWCFLLAWPLFLIFVCDFLNKYIGNEFFSTTHTWYIFPEWSLDAMGTGLWWIWILLAMLWIWASVNTIQFIYDIIFGIYDRYYFRKWGENAY